MSSCGIIAEYNPFHTGHAYHLEQTRIHLPEATIVVCMSGNFMQRGEPAILDKWTRAQMALENGADIVVEQSVLGTVQSADYFARAGVRTLKQMGCSYLSFGSEMGDVAKLEQIAHLVLETEKASNRQFKAFRNKAESYPVQMDQVIRQTLPEEFAAYTKNPNAKLGVSYLVANLKTRNELQPLVVTRQGSDHHDQSIQDELFASGTAIRTALLAGSFEAIERFLPTGSKELLEQQPFVHWEQLWPYLKYKLLVTPKEELQGVLHIEEGIENRLKEYAHRAKNMNEFLTLVKNKRWTWVRIQRACTSIMLNLTKQEAQSFYGNEQPIRILGFTERGQRYLQEKKDHASFVTNMRKQDYERFAVTVRSDDLYRLADSNAILEQNRARVPIQVNNFGMFS